MATVLSQPVLQILHSRIQPLALTEVCAIPLFLKPGKHYSHLFDHVFQQTAPEDICPGHIPAIDLPKDLVPFPAVVRLSPARAHGLIFVGLCLEASKRFAPQRRQYLWWTPAAILCHLCPTTWH